MGKGFENIVLNFFFKRVGKINYYDHSKKITKISSADHWGLFTVEDASGMNLSMLIK